MKSILSYLGQLLRWKRSAAPTAETDTLDTNGSALPPSPRELLRGREIYEIPILRRRINREVDTPLAALYRLLAKSCSAQFWLNSTRLKSCLLRLAQVHS
jgi:hypothetical protein